MKTLRFFIVLLALAGLALAQTNELPLTITTLPDLPLASLGAPYTFTMQATGGVSPYTWTLSANLPPGLALDSETGKITGTPTTEGTFNFWITVRDQQPQSTYGQFAIKVGPRTLRITTDTPLPEGMETVRYSQALGGVNGTPPYTWSKFSGDLPPGLTLSAAGVISGYPSEAGTWTFGIRLNDSAAEVAMKIFSLKIVPAEVKVVTDPPPPNGLINAPYSFTLTATLGTPGYFWEIVSGALPPGLTLNSTTGKISGTPTKVGGFSFQVKARDRVGIEGTANFEISIDFSRLAIVTATLPAATEGVPYSQTLTGTGGVAPYRWNVVDGSLPQGLTLKYDTGVLSGTPATRGTTTLTIRLTDVDGRNVSSNMTFTVQPPVSITTTSLPAVAVGTAYSQTLAAKDGTTPYSWAIASGTLPAGLALDPATGKISGTPTLRGTSTFTVRVTDSNTSSATASLSITVQTGPLAITAATPPAGVVGSAYSLTLSAIGGVSPYTWAIASGSLPAGLSLEAATGKISGTPTARGTSAFTVRVTDSARATKDAQLSIAVQPAPLAIGTASLSAAAAGTAYNQALSAAGGVAPYTWSLTAGALPPGLTLDRTAGTLSGTPTTQGSYNFTIQVKCSADMTASASYTLTVTVPALAIGSGSTLPAGRVQAAYSHTLVATGGVPAYSWRVSTGTLPVGLTLSAAGVISGTPTTAGVSSFTVEVRDSAQTAATMTATITIEPPAVSISTATLAAGTAGSAYSQTIAAAGGTPPYTFSVSAGELPPGLAINAQTGALTGTPTAGGTSNFVVKVTDAGQTPLSATQSFSITVNLPAAANPTFSGLADTMNAAQQPAFTVALATAYPLPLSGTLTLTFAPESGLPDDPAITFLSGGRTLQFTVPAGQTQASFSTSNVGLQTGTVAGTITLTANFRQGGTDVTPNPAPTRTIRIGRAAPGISSVRATRVTGGVEIQIFGYSTPRDITQARFRFTAAAGSTLQGADVTVPLTQVFTTWFRDAASNQFGTAFRYVQPFTVSGDTNGITSVEVTLSNSSGDSQAATANF